jgi:hypothetical protein
MKHERLIFGIGAVLILLILAGIIVQFAWRVSEISGTVTSQGKALAGATVRVKATDFKVVTDASGNFVLNGFLPAFSVHVTAWQDGYYVGGQSVLPWQRNIDISLNPYLSSDNREYSWVLPEVTGRTFLEEALVKLELPLAAKLSFNHLFLPLSSKLTLGCADCHSNIYKEYAANAHARGADNIIFSTTYNGTDTTGRQSPPTMYGSSRDYGLFPLPPDITQPWFGPGFKLDFPDQAGNCANCHEPGQAVNAPNNTDINKISSKTVRGTHCDFCHKIFDVTLDPKKQLPGENMPGVQSIEMRRPGGGPQVFFGQLDDVDVGPDTRLPLQNESAVCAACHNASFWGTPIYQSYSEWLTSPYPVEGKTCQSCHMPPDGVTDNFAKSHGGVARDPGHIFSHTFPGAADTFLLQHTAKLEVTAAKKDNRITVEVRVTNENGGHDIPTDQPMRNIILLVQADDSSGKTLTSTGNQTVPDWGGTGSEPDNYAALPGKGYAKVLQELWTEVSPSIAYWRQTTILEDNRIHARETDLSSYEFQPPSDSGPVTVTAKLIFRRAFKQLAEQKGWNNPDILMNQVSLTIP